MTKPIYEIRDYTIESEWFDAYKEWAKDIAAPWLKENLEVIDFWMDEGEPPEVSGSNPIVSPNGQPNVTWIIKWEAERQRERPLTMSSDEWKERGRNIRMKTYLHLNVRFMGNNKDISINK